MTGALCLLLLASDPALELETALKSFTQVLAAAKQNAADPVNDDQAIYTGAIPGMLRRLDPHSVFFDPQQFQQLQQMERSETKGFGTVVSVLPGRVIILQTLPGTPSAKAGLTPGDEILAVNNIRLDRLEMDQLIEVLGAARQQQAALVVQRPGSVRRLQFNLNPELMDSPSVDRAFLLQPEVGYVRIASFDPKTGQQFKQAVERIGGAKLKALVIDLRNNSGGVVQSAIECTSLFLKPGERLLSVRGRAKKTEEVDVPKNAPAPFDFPVAVLINEKTASASEIVAGALQDHKRAVILGERSFGKGLVQSVFPLTSSTAMALTTAFYYTPSGRSIQRPLAGVQLESAALSQPVENKTGGITPEITVLPGLQSRLRQALDATGLFPAFATEFLHTNKVDNEFHVTPAILDEFQVYASSHRIQPGVAEWLADRSWIQSRLEQEIFNQSLGVEKGDEVEAQRDPVIRKSIEALAAKTAL